MHLLRRGDPTLFCDRFGRGDDAARDEARPAFVLAREDEDRIAFGDVLATIHRLLRAECERLRPRVADLGLDRENHSPGSSSRSPQSVAPPRGSRTVTTSRCRTCRSFRFEL